MKEENFEELDEQKIKQSDVNDSENESVNTEDDNKNSCEDELIQIPKSKIKEYEEKIKDNEYLAKRLKADFENYKKCVDREKEKSYDFASYNLIEKLLPVLDTFDQAILNTKVESERKGIGLVYSQLIEVLSKVGLRKIECIGKEFDPYYHDIIMTVESNKDDNIILEEFQTGYMLNDKILRHSKVKVAKKIQDGCINKKEDELNE
ncbi:MAG: nucleotide exchange factor GrpE [Candidatus Woesearchaeota archaeon]